MSTDRLWTLGRVEIAAGLVIGHDLVAPRPAADRSSFPTPLAALEDSVRLALLEPPCVVSFSGGRDSSVVLAIACRVARREGLALPIPFTFRFPGIQEADESAWQDTVIRHLRLGDWIHIEVEEDLDVVGPVATRILRRHGVLWPPNAYVHVPVFERARGGCVLTGVEGDGLFGGWSFARLGDVLGGRVRLELRDVLRLVKGLAPRAVRRWVAARRSPLLLPWLRPAAQLMVASAWAEESAEEPARWDHRVAWWARRRYHRLAKQGLDLLAADVGAHAVHPLLDSAFLAALAREGGRSGFGDRTRMMRALFSGLLPETVLERRDKANFTRAFWRTPARTFSERWMGEGIDHDLVDADALRRAWSAPIPDFRTAMLLQSAWLATEGAEQCTA